MNTNDQDQTQAQEPALTAVRAKMQCNSLGQTTLDGPITKVELGCVYSADAATENANFTRYTPLGELHDGD